jgi:Uma2 family endonuclease
LHRSAEEGDIVGMPATDDRVTTIEELQALPDDGLRHELLDGVHVVTPAPRLDHQAALRELMVALVPAVAGRPDLQLFSSPADVVLGPQTLVQPDLFVIQQDPEHPPHDWSDIGIPVLAIEILSPTTALRDRGVKRRIYQRAGVAEYWIVDLDARLVERWTPKDERPEIADTTLQWELPDSTSHEIDVAALFARVLG